MRGNDLATDLEHIGTVTYPARSLRTVHFRQGHSCIVMEANQVNEVKLTWFGEPMPERPAMTSETRTIDLAALATELEREGWEVNYSNPHLKTLSHQRRYVWAHEDRIESWQEDEYGNTVSITLPDPVWQSALAIVQRHIAATEGAPADESQ